MQIDPYLNFNGDCRQAMEFYHQVLGGDLQMMTHADMPMEGMLEGWEDKILNAQLTLNGETIMASDAPPEWYQPPASMYVALQLDSVAEAERVFAAFAEGATVQMEMAEQPWAHVFGMLVDRFGVPWMVSCNK